MLDKICKAVLVISVLFQSTHALAAESVASSTGSADGAASSFKFKGDFRLRYEYVRSPSTPASQQRTRIRARFGGEVKPLENARVGLQLATGQIITTTGLGDPLARHQTLSDGFDTKPISLSQAFLDWQPIPESKSFNVILGKMENPIYRPLGSQLVWDNEINPEGASAVVTQESGQTKLRFLGAYYVLKENANAPDVYLGALQAMAGFKSSDQFMKLNTGVSYYPYQNLQGAAIMGGSGNSRGNSSGTSGSSTVYTENYHVLEAFLEPAFAISKLPTALMFEYIRNMASTSSGENEGWITGIRFGGTANPGDWQLQYGYRRVKRDATVGAFSEDKFAGGGTNVKGHEASLAYKIAKSTLANAIYYNTFNNVSISPRDYWRILGEVTFTF